MNIASVKDFVEIVAGVIAILTGVFTLPKFFIVDARIEHPPHQSENGGRYITLSGYVKRAKWDMCYWIAVQPHDQREYDMWWPQNHALKIDTGGPWRLEQARLGRSGPEGRADVNATYTVALFEVPREVNPHISDVAQHDEGIGLIKGFRMIHSIEVRRVRQ